MSFRYGFLLVVILCNASHAGLLEDFYEEYPEASTNYAEPFRKSLAVETTYWLRNSSRPVQRKAFFSDELSRIEVEIANREVVVCVGERWAFSASRNKGDDDYSLERVDKLSNVKSIEDLDPELRNLKDTHSYHYCVYGTPLADIIKANDFEVLESEEVDHLGQPCLRLKYRFSRQGYESTETVTLDPNRSWVIRQVESLTVPDGKAFLTIIAYENGNSHFPSEATVTLDGKPYLRTLYKSWNEEQLDAEKFTLSYYGFPNYSETNPVWTWIAVGAAVIVASVLLQRRFFGSKYERRYS